MLKTLELMGIELWQLKQESRSMEKLKEQLENCERCTLAKRRSQVVMGEGNLAADIVFVGEAPGEQEDLQGRPFVGKAGQLLDQMLRAINLDRKQIYITNILKCRPPQNRDPYGAEIKNCTPYLQQQLTLINPQVMVALGKVAANYLLQTESTIGKLRGNWFDYKMANKVIPLLVIYHPAYLLRSPREKKVMYRDLLKLLAKVK